MGISKDKILKSVQRGVITCGSEYITTVTISPVNTLKSKVDLVGMVTDLPTSYSFGTIEFVNSTTLRLTRGRFSTPVVTFTYQVTEFY
jgi:hypothetical protein